MVKQELRPLYVQVHPDDNVAIVVNEGGLRAGARFDSGLVLIENIPEAHKVALNDIPAGTPIVRYGSVIGFAERDMRKGSWVHEEKMRLPSAPALDDLPLATDVPEALPPLEGYTFQGFVNDDGTVGTKNILGITTTVQCVAATVDYAVKRIRQEILPRYPNVDDVIALTHNYGCGVAIDAPNAEIPIRTLRNLSLNPNLGGAPMVVSLGCEKLQPARLMPSSTLPILSASPYVVQLQDERTTALKRSSAAIMEMAEKRLQMLNSRRRTTRPASDLIVGMQCGGSDAFSGVTANPAVGYAADLLVRAGATVIFSEVTEVRDAIHLLTARAATEEIARDLVREMAWYDAYLSEGGVDRSANPSPGNKRGGLTNIVEKALGSIAKAGSSSHCRSIRPRRAGDKERLDLCGDACERLCMRHIATGCIHEHAYLHDRAGNSVRAGDGPGDQSGLAIGAGGALARLDRRGCGNHCNRCRDHRAGRMADL